jgi:diguanylate cyclase (GGDEF)-like protein/PAS domain S-box-containing protein
MMVNIRTSRYESDAGWFVRPNWTADYQVRTPWFAGNSFPLDSSRKSRYLFHRLVSQSNCLKNMVKEGVCYVDHHWQIQSLNAEAERLLGIKLNDVADHSFSHLVNLMSPDHRISLLSYQSLAKCYEHNEVYRHEDAILKRQNGTEIDVEFAFCPLMHDQQFSGFVLLLRDISQLKRLEDNLIAQVGKSRVIIEEQIQFVDEESKEQLQRVFAAEHDVLTGLMNRYQFEFKLQELIQKSREFSLQHAVISLDLDQFTVVNDACGHLAGDECLRQIARLIESKVRKWDIVARLGGDEFAVQLMYCNQVQALRIADDISRAIHNHRFIWKGMSFTFSASMGIVMVDNHETDVNSVMRKANLACNTAKEQGRNRTYLFREDDVHINARHGEVSCIGQITNALEDNRFDLFFQKIIPIQNQVSKGEHYEILIRMFDEHGEHLSQLFLPAAERYNMISRIDSWVVNKTCELLSNHPEKLANLNLCAINLSGMSLNDPQFFDHVLTVINHYHLPLDKLCFEITETGTIANINQAIKFITRLRALGIHFALDDFGSGLSSFAYLRSMPVDYVKIDGMFVKAMDTNAVDAAMVKSINDMAHIMGKKTVAEFVENARILEMLRELGVDFAQGYGIEKPQRFVDFLENKL